MVVKYRRAFPPHMSHASLAYLQALSLLYLKGDSAHKAEIIHQLPRSYDVLRLRAMGNKITHRYYNRLAPY